MEQNKKILVAIDGTEASSKTVAYVAEMTKGTANIEILLFHLIAPIPAALREHGGSEDPVKEEQLGQELREAQSRWIEGQQKKCAPLLNQMKTSLVESGVPLQAISIDSDACVQEATIDQCLLDTARDWDAGTIVVGWDSFPWYEELFKTHIAEKLIRQGEGLTFWVVR